jgi:hypothetical protein
MHDNSTIPTRESPLQIVDKQQKDLLEDTTCSLDDRWLVRKSSVVSNKDKKKKGEH